MKISYLFVMLYFVSDSESKSIKRSTESPRQSRSASDKDHENPSIFARRKTIYEDTISFTHLTGSNKNGNTFKALESPIHALDGIDITIPLKFVTHDWGGNCKEGMCKTIGSEYAKSKNPPTQVIMADYSELATPLDYLTVARHANRIAEVFAFVLNDIIDRGMSPSIIHMIGYSLGAHLCGLTAAIVNKNLVNEKIGRITGLDPPLLYFEVSTDGIQKDQASFVDIVHTSVGVIGIPDPRGHADFYPNAGLVPQPHCEHKFEKTQGSCSHKVSWLFFHKSIGNTQTKAYSCSSFTRFTFFECSKTEEMIFGDGTPRSARGVFYFQGAVKV